MSRLRYVKGNITEITGGTRKIYAKEGYEVHSNAQIINNAKGGKKFGEPETPSVLKLENGVDIFTEFRPLTSYNGEFGFDWLEWDEKDAIIKVQNIDISNFEYLFNNTKNEYVEVATDAKLKDKIKDDYKKHQINYPYYIPWLNISPNQGEIKLNMFTKSIITGEDISKEVITFEKNDSFQVTIDGLVNENIKYSPNGQLKEISIKCIKPSVESDIIAKNEKGKIIGKIRVKDTTNSYNLPVRLVFVVKNSPTKDAEINQLLSDFKNDGIEDYLNKNSLNQALIKTFVEIDAKYHLAFDENDWSGKFYDKTNNWLTNRKDSLGGKVTYIDDDGQEFKDVECEHILDKFLTDYKSNFEIEGKKFKGILLFITNINKDPLDNEGGVSRTQPVKFREAIVFKSNLKDKSTYSHEIAHALGLEHFFCDINNLNELNQLKNSIQQNEAAIKSRRDNIEIDKKNIKIYQDNIKEYEDYQKNHPNYYKENLKVANFVKEQKEKIQQDQKEIKNRSVKIKEIENMINRQKENLDVYKMNKYKFKKGSTKNVMDYSTIRDSFTKWQWQIMQSDIKNYYGNISNNL